MAALEVFVLMLLLLSIGAAYALGAKAEKHVRKLKDMVKEAKKPSQRLSIELFKTEGLKEMAMSMRIALPQKSLKADYLAALKVAEEQRHLTVMMHWEP